ncbi:MAG: hypothetical protein HC837_11585 [Chloroflexaceae bacterium]|nr:hypothetical protein [Chloroflexaceae bacterium]
MAKPISELVDELPADNITVKALHALDFVMPGEWENLVGFEATIKKVARTSDQERIQKIGERAIHLYNDSSQGYQRAMWLYQTVDSTDKALATAALANKVGHSIGFLSFLSKITPKADRAQAIDLSLKLVVEVVAFCSINGLPGDSIGDFVKSLGKYSKESLMRMNALICFDGILPLGPDFVRMVIEILEGLTPDELEKNETYDRIKESVPGGNTQEQLNFIQQSFSSVSDWINGFVKEHDLSADKIVGSLKNFIEISDDKLDYLAAFIDMTTNYYEHTGTQTLAHRLVRRAMSEI